MRAPVLCFRLELMRIPIKPLFALVLAVILPMRGFASAAHCEPPGQGHGAHSHGVPSALRTDAARGDLSLQAAGEGHCAGGKSSPHAHACGDCCCGAAAVLTAPRFTVPRAAAALIARRLAWPHPALAIDRLDRPPRQPA
jgi:uncharacterized low-complexity protein